MGLNATTRHSASRCIQSRTFNYKPVVASLIAIFTSVSSTTGRAAGMTVDEIDATRGWRIFGDTSVSGSTVGAVEAIGDINADGLPDFATTFVPQNLVSIIFGKSSGFDQPTQAENLSGVDGFVIDLPDGHASFLTYPGYTLAGLGDFNGDGIDDFAIGYPKAPPNNDGAVYVVYGRRGAWPAEFDVTSITTDTGLTIPGYNNIELGTAVAAIGDVNNDSRADLLTCTRTNTSPRVYEPCFVLFGKAADAGNVYQLPTLTGDQGFTILPGNPGSFTPGDFTSADRIGDINGDGIDDIALSTIHYTGSRYSIPEGDKSYIIFGSETPPTAPVVADDLTSPTGFVVTGSDYISRAGDVNQDGIDDMFIGTHVLYGSGAGFDSPLSLENLPDALGHRVDTRFRNATFAGDINGDGIDDFAIGDPENGAYYSEPSSGTVHIVFGSDRTANSTIDIQNDLNGANGFQIDGSSIRDDVGMDIASVGDVNGDGIDDLAFGFSTVQQNNVDTGNGAYVLFGTTTAQPDYLDSCGPLFFTPATSNARTYIWQDCPLGEPNGQWHVREAHGELLCPRGCGFSPPRERSYRFALKSDGDISDIELLDTESGDMSTQISPNQFTLTGNLVTGSDELDGFDFRLQGESSVCVDTTSGAISYGAERRFVRTPIDLRTGLACTIDSPTPSVSFFSTIDPSESSELIYVTVRLFPALPEATTLKLATRGITATPGRDFYGFSRTLEFAAGETRKTVAIQLRDDNEVEPAETFAVRAYGASNPSIENAETIIEFYDNDIASRPRILVSDATVNEGDGFASISLSLSFAWDEDVSVTLFTRPRTASGGGVDYFGRTREFTIQAGQTERIFKVGIVDDEESEGTEELTIGIRNTSTGFGRVLDVPLDDAVIFILDNDPEP